MEITGMNNGTDVILTKKEQMEALSEQFQKEKDFLSEQTDRIKETAEPFRINSMGEFTQNFTSWIQAMEDCQNAIGAKMHSIKLTIEHQNMVNEKIAAGKGRK